MDVVDPDLALRILRYVLLARRFEERLIALFAGGRLKGWVHSGLGQEATGAGAAIALGYTLISLRLYVQLLHLYDPVRFAANEPKAGGFHAVE